MWNSAQINVRLDSITTISLSLMLHVTIENSFSLSKIMQSDYRWPDVIQSFSDNAANKIHLNETKLLPLSKLM